MEITEEIVKVLNQTFDGILDQLDDIDTSEKDFGISNSKHRDLIEKYAKVLSKYYVGKLGNMCSAMLLVDMSDKTKLDYTFNKFENKMDETVDTFAKDMKNTFKKVKKYFGYRYEDEDLNNFLKYSFKNDFSSEKETFVDWASNLEIENNLQNTTTKEEELTA